jgi:hypothetical protein
LLVTFVNWPPGVYASDPGATADIWHNGKYSQKVTAELKDIISKSEQWNKALPAATLQVAIVARPSTSARAGKITFKINEVHSDRRKLEVAFTTLETFEDTAGQFLAAEPYFLSASALEQLKTHLDTLESETASPR